MEKIHIREAIKAETMLVHSRNLWDALENTSRKNRGYMLKYKNRHLTLATAPVSTTEHLLACNEYYNRLSLYVCEETFLCAKFACGGVIEVCRAVAEGRIRNGFAIVR